VSNAGSQISWTTSSPVPALLRGLAKLGMRRGLSRLASGIGGRIRVRCGTVTLQLDLASAQERHLFLGLSEREVIALTRTFLRAGDTAVDVGSNIGFHTAVMANLAGASGRVYSFEPNPDLRSRLDYIVDHNPLKNIEVIQAAVSDAGGEALLQVSSLSGLSSLLTNWNPETTIRSERVPAVTLDGFLEVRGVDSIAVVKIDVEGHEAAVFKGARSTLERRAVKVFVFELTPPSHPAYSRRRTDEMLASLESCGYSLVNLAQNKGRRKARNRAIDRRSILDEPERLAPGYNIAAIRGGDHVGDHER